MTTESKVCTACGKEKPLSAFAKRAGSSSRRGTCRTCIRRRKQQPDDGGLKAAEVNGSEDEAAGERTELGVEQETVEIAAMPPKRRKRKRKRKRGGSKASAGQHSAEEQADGAESIEDAAETAVTSTAAVNEQPSRVRKRKQRRRKRSHANAKQEKAEAGEAPAAVRPPDRKIVPIKGKFTYKTSILNDRGRGVIRLRGHRETGKRWSTDIPTEMAVRMVEEGAAGIIHPGLIHKLYTKTDFRLLVLQRDNYICRYCGQFGDTIDHVMPKSKGGLSSPMNCVCACADCNLKKADSLDFVYDEIT
ncbi:HNH endonuclease [Paenibacillus sp. R14(2021)]|uniref:HNH endonuclease n=1 Tax=Paenibacillus sp. R14(2021) TaxID=2859228 RepID=UPI001C611462|nr:HNH endonuclease signature motif containing protein [Paenibacillus sp. R14(2021)]